MNVMANNPFMTAEVSKEEERYFKDVAASWNILQNSLTHIEEDMLVKLFRWEMDNQRRVHLLNRIKSRHNRLRDQRERKELFEDFTL